MEIDYSSSSPLLSKDTAPDTHSTWTNDRDSIKEALSSEEEGWEPIDDIDEGSSSMYTLSSDEEMDTQGIHTNTYK